LSSRPIRAQEFIDNLEVRKFFGIGKVTAEKLNKMGIWFGRDLKQIDRFELVRLFGKSGNYYFDICRGIDHRPVEPSRERKSVGAEQTFSTDLFQENELGIGNVSNCRYPLGKVRTFESQSQNPHVKIQIRRF
jgi:DNA polymerase IV